MSKAIDREEILSELAKLAFFRANDAVKLAFLQDAGPAAIARLDLRGVESIKTGEKGVEIKLVDREKLIGLLLAATEERPDPAAAAGGLISAIDGAAEKIGTAAAQAADEA